MKLGQKYKNIIKSIVAEEKKIDEARGKSLNIPDFNDEKYKHIFDKVFYHIQQKGVYDMSIFTVWDIISYLEQNPSYYKEMAHILGVDEITNDLEYEILNYFDEYSNDKNSLAYKIFYDLSIERIEGVFINLNYEMIDNKIYREISTPKDIKQVLEYSEKNGLGCCWAKRYDMATAYYGNEDIDNNLPPINNYVLVGELTDKNINWVATLILRAIYEEENEIRLKADVPVKLVKIIDRNTNKRYNVNKIFSSGNKLAYDQYNESKNIMESVNTQYLYHGMWKDQYEFCKKQNKLFGHSVSETFYGYNKNGERIGRRFKGISTSRNAQVSINFMENIIKEYTNEWKSNPSAIFSKRIGDNEKYVTKDDDLSYVVLVLDYNKIKQNNKIVPLSFLAGSQKDYYGDEQEELIIGDLKNLNNYVVDVMEFNNNINKNTLKSKPLEEAFVKNPFNNEVLCYYSKLESEVKQIIKNKFNDIPVRVLYDFVNKVYIFGNANTLIHVDLIDKMKQYGKTDFGYRYPIKEEEQYKWMDKNCAMFKIINTNDYKSYTRSDGYKMGVIGKLDTDMYVILRDNTLAMERSKITGNFVPDELQKCKKVPMLQNVKFVKYDIRDIGMFTSKEQLPQKLVNESAEPKLNDNFWKWFGKSKVVDENGNPLILYHGSPNTFEIFDENYFGSNNIKGFWFSNDKKVGEHYKQKSGKLYSCYIKLENPYILKTPGMSDEERLKRTHIFRSDKNPRAKLACEDLKKEGYDGILSKDDDGYIEVVVFYPNNIKSVDNNGNWSLEVDNINESFEPKLNDNFKKWFGNSKVVDENGNPLVVYHGTRSKFNEFNRKYAKNGFFFTTEKRKNSVAGYYAYYYDDKGSILPCYIKLENPLIVHRPNGNEDDIARANGTLSNYDGIIVIYDDKDDWEFSDYDYIEKKRKPLTIKNGDVIEYIVFDPNNIKSVNNNGEWSSNKNNIFESTAYGGANWQNSMDALGNVPATIGHNLFMTMFPYHFLSLCPKYNYGDDKFFDDYIESKKPIGIPFLIVDFNFDTKTIEVQDHEGRHRVAAISRRKNGNIVDIPVGILYSKNKYPQIPSIEELRKNWTIVSQKGDREYNVGQFSVYNSFPKASNTNWFNLYENKLADVQEDMKWILSSDSILFSCYPPSYHIMLKCIKDNNVEVFEFNFKDKAEKYVKLCRSLLARFEKGFKAYTVDTLMKKIDTYDGVPISKDGVRTILNAYYGQLI